MKFFFQIGNMGFWIDWCKIRMLRPCIFWDKSAPPSPKKFWSPAKYQDKI